MYYTKLHNYTYTLHRYIHTYVYVYFGHRNISKLIAVTNRIEIDAPTRSEMHRFILKRYISPSGSEHGGKFFILFLSRKLMVFIHRQLGSDSDEKSKTPVERIHSHLLVWRQRDYNRISFCWIICMYIRQVGVLIIVFGMASF